MTKLRAATVAAALVALPAPPAHATTHTLHASCTPAWFFVGEAVAYAVSGGDVRGVHTEVTCTWYPWLGDPPHVYHGEAAGPVAVTAGNAGGELALPYLCVSAYAFWADGTSHTTETACGSSLGASVDWSG